MVHSRPAQLKFPVFAKEMSVASSELVKVRVGAAGSTQRSMLDSMFCSVWKILSILRAKCHLVKALARQMGRPVLLILQALSLLLEQ